MNVLRTRWLRAGAARTAVAAVAAFAVLGGTAVLVDRTTGGSSAAAATTSELDTLTSAAAMSGDGPRATELRKLRADLAAARALTGDARTQALAKIRADARAGAYGPGVQRRVERRADRRQVIFALLPDALQTDIKAMRAAPAADRPAMRKQIMSKALAGDYGPQVAAAAHKLQDLRGH